MVLTVEKGEKLVELWSEQECTRAAVAKISLFVFNCYYFPLVNFPQEQDASNV